LLFICSINYHSLRIEKSIINSAARKNRFGTIDGRPVSEYSFSNLPSIRANAGPLAHESAAPDDRSVSVAPRLNN
jgi:hypothetical protein